METPESVLQLVERFEEHGDEYRAQKYNETQLRRDFLDPFFAALGWDMTNKSGTSEKAREVIMEYSLKIEGRNKAPDYCFRAGGADKFFVEAKKPAVNLQSDARVAFQTRAYGWNRGLPFCVLTDFEEFAVYDCRFKPVATDSSQTARTFYCKYSEYPQKWQEIAALFSRAAVQSGALEVAATKTSKKGAQPFDADFLQLISGWRERLAHNIAQRNRDLGLSQSDLNYAVQMTIDRILFLRMCEDRDIEPFGQLQKISKQKGVYEEMAELFRQADNRFNSGLFHFSKDKTRRAREDDFTLQLQIDDAILQDIAYHLYPPGPYNFRVMSVEILGQVYEQFLGKVIRFDGRKAVVEDKPEVRKAGGVYYTPEYIVRYIVENTVGKLCAGKTPKDVEQIKVLDPACGSGSFLIGAYQFLLDWHLEWYRAHDPEKLATRKNPVVFQAPAAPDAPLSWRLTSSEKKRILLSNIHGVDIDRQAVEVTKLSLLLKMLEDESAETLPAAQGRLLPSQERLLPDLEANIKCGNSLIGHDFYDDGAEYSRSERERINAFDWDEEFPEIMKRGGFDAVIGNPPYGATLSQTEIAYLSGKFQLQEYQLDSYLLFVEKSHCLLNDNGLCGMIIPNTWLLNLQSRSIRKYIFSSTQVENIVHYHKPVFVAATVDTEVVILKNRKPAKDHEIAITLVGRDGTNVCHQIPQARWQSGDGNPVNIFERTEFVALADKMRRATPLDKLYVITQGTKPFQVGKGKPHQTREIVNEKPFIATTKKDSTFRPLLRGSLIQKYQILWEGNYWISFGDWLAEPRYSAQYDAPSKIVIRQTGDSLLATLDESQFVVRDNLYTIVPRQTEVNLKYLLGLINSRLLNWFYQIVVNPEKGEALAQVKRGHIAILPIPPINFSDKADAAKHDAMVKLVERMLELHRQKAKARTAADQTQIERQIAATDKRIDALVYELYELTDEEIALVENENAR